MTSSPRSVADVAGIALAGLGVEDVFAVIGSGNFVITEALDAAGAHVWHARHENGAICMADAYARVSGRVGVCSVHQGPGFTNMLTGLTEAAKSGVPLLVLAADTPAHAARSNFKVDQAGVARRLGAAAEFLRAPETVHVDVARAHERARLERRPVVLNLPIDVQAAPASLDGAIQPPAMRGGAGALAPSSSAVAEVATRLANARRPALIAGRGAGLAKARADLIGLAEATGAVLTTTAMAHGLFGRDRRCAGIAGGFLSPDAARALRQADLVLVFGASLTRWTTRNGSLIDAGACVVQIDIDPEAFGAHHRVDVTVLADVGLTARALLDALGATAPRAVQPLRSWREEPYGDASSDGRIDPRTLTIALEDLLPDERSVVIDSGHFMGWPAMYLSVPDTEGFVFTQAFQSIGLGLPNAIGAAVARPDRLTVAAVGDGGALMALPELETAARLALPILVVIYNDAAYAAEVHHFGPMGRRTDLVRFPDTDFAALARASGAAAVTVRRVDDLAAITPWLEQRRGPMFVDAKLTRGVVAEWLEEAFR